MNRVFVLLIALIVALPILLLQLARTDSVESGRDSLADTDPTSERRSAITLFCAASNQAVVQKIVEDYRRDFDSEVYVNFGSSQSLLSQIEASRTGDLFMPADASFLEAARSKGLLSQTIPVARMRAVIAVPSGNPKAIRSLADCLRPQIRFVQANSDAAGIGHLTRSALDALGIWNRVDRATTAYRGNVTEVANDIVVGSADAGIVYDAILHDYPDLHPVSVPELDDAVSNVEIGIISTSPRKQSAARFVEYLTADQHGRKRYREFGFDVPLDRSDNGPRGSNNPED
ncbi:molybdate ABC transporter substrate-binding protein [Rhodopirellula sallentina]|nr:molybdate ABC transporter substrate-binding protein [Rhodopirellula sallentina]